MRVIRSASVLAAVGSLSVPSLACASTAEGRDDSAGAKALVAKFSCPVQATSAGAVAAGTPGEGKLQVVTTVAPITSIVANIAGDRADVHGVIPEGEDSHTFEPKPSVAALMSRADVVFVNGLKLEDATQEIAEENVAEGSEVIELGTLTIGPDEYIYDFSFPEDGGKPNPHLWTNPPMAKCYAAIAASAMSRADPANADHYVKNYLAYATRIDELDQLMIEATAGMPARNRALLTYHDAYAYFAAHYGWTIIGAVQVSSFEDPTPREVTDLVKQIRATRVPAIFGSEVFPSPLLQQLATETGVEYVDTLRDDDLPGAPGGPDHSYLGLMKFDLVTMVESLGGDASKLRSFDASDVVTDSADYPQ